ncbi:MAG: VOC family protein, partial [Alphaproteobacteria bacterium]
MATTRETAPALVFSHFGLYCSDFPAMRDFYTRVFGFAVSDTGHRANGTSMAFMTRRAFEHHQLVLASNHPAGAPSTINQLGFTATDLGELRRIKGLLEREAGISDLVVVDHGISWTLYFLDPCDNRVAVSVDTGWFAPQPACWPLDLTQSDTDIAATTERRCQATEGGKTRADWRRDLEARLRADGTLIGQATPEIEADASPDAEGVFRFEPGEADPPAEPYPKVAMSSIGLYATDLARLETFYVGVLGYAVTGKGRMESIGSVPATDYVYLTRDPDQFAQ